MILMIITYIVWYDVHNTVVCLLHGFMLLATTRAPVRLTNGVNQFEGRVEVYYNGQWGTVCDNNWDMVDAKYVIAECDTCNCLSKNP